MPMEFIREKTLKYAVSRSCRIDISKALGRTGRATPDSQDHINGSGRALDDFWKISQTARIGLWECALSSEKLRWSDCVYDLFGLPRGLPVDRGLALGRYTPSSRRDLEIARRHALVERKGFTLDAEIETYCSDRRWIRITALVDCDNQRPVRLFGFKQDITADKLQLERMRHLAEFDSLTGLANRATFDERLSSALRTRAKHKSLALILVDLDGFKSINDTLGHSAGDECLKETARRLQSICEAALVVARLGGDEFAVLMECDARSPSSAVSYARRIVVAMKTPVLVNGRHARFGASVGVAQSACDTDALLLEMADDALYRAKAAGRNAFRVHGDDTLGATPYTIWSEASS